MINQYFPSMVVLAASIVQALLSTFFSVLLALPCAYFFNRFTWQRKKVLLSTVPLLCIMPSKLTGLGITLLYGLKGFTAIILAHAALNIPFAFYLFYGAYKNMNPHWHLIAQELGATRWQAYKDIDVPFLRSTILSAGVIIFLLCFTSFSLPQILGSAQYHMTPDILMSEYYQHEEYWMSGVYGLLRLVVLLPLCFLTSRPQNNGWLAHAMIQKRDEEYCVARHGAGWLLLFFGVGVLTLGPLLAVLLNTIDHKVFAFFCAFFSAEPNAILQMPCYRVVINSVLLAAASSIAAVFFGYVLCKALQVLKSSVIKGILVLMTSGIFIVGSVGCGILFAQLAHITYFSKFSIAVVCHLVLNYPFAYRIIKAHLGSWQSEWDLSAQSFGATSFDRVRTLELPFLRASLIQALYIGFGLSLTEVGAGSVLKNDASMTIAGAIRLLRAHGQMDAVIGLTIILLLLVFGFTFLVGMNHKTS